jgi:hypothetical protein
MLNTLEWFHIYKETKRQNQINDRHTISPNAIFYTLLFPTSLTITDLFHTSVSRSNIHSSYRRQSSTVYYSTQQPAE